MKPILDKARAAQNALERLAAAIPGFKGYHERELRRDADRLQREHLAARLDAGKRGLDDAADRATRSGSLDVINDVESARKRLERVSARLRYAARGYSGFFDLVKVDEPALARAYELDLALLDGVEAVRTAADAARAAAPGELRGHLQAMTAALDALDARLDDREAILQGMK